MKISRAFVLMVGVSGIAWGQPTAAPRNSDYSVRKEGDNFLVSDVLVKDLSCDGLTRDNALMSLQPDAFNSRELPFGNFASGRIFGDGQCWAMAQAQRAFYYLARVGAATPQEEKENEEYALDLVRGTVYGRRVRREASPRNEWDQYQIGDREPANLGEEPPVDYKVFRVADWEKFMDKLDHRPAGQRSLSSEMVSKEDGNVFNPLHLPLIFEDRERSDAKNAETMRYLLDQVGQGRMPIILVRRSRTWQHVVAVKKVEKIGDDRYSMSLYDSNGSGNTVEYYDNDFHYGGIVGVFVTEDIESMNKIQDAVYSYYARICADLEAGK